MQRRPAGLPSGEALHALIAATAVQGRTARRPDRDALTQTCLMIPLLTRLRQLP